MVGRIIKVKIPLIFNGIFILLNNKNNIYNLILNLKKTYCIYISRKEKNMKFSKLSKEEAYNKIYECEPVINFVKTDDLFKKLVILSAWHHSRNIYTFNEELNKMEELLGKYIFKGKKFGNIEFFKTTAIWAFSYKNKNNVFFLYLSDEGLSLEISKDIIPDINEVYDELIDILVDKSNLYKFLIYTNF